MRELIERRTSNAKVFDMENGKFQVQIGGGIAHHQKNGAWLETDTNWADRTDRFSTGEYPFTIDFIKATRTLTIDYQDGNLLTIQPANMRVPTSITRVGNTVTLVRLWTGITLKLILTPEGLHFNYIKTSITFVNPSFDVTGDWGKYYGTNVYEVGDTPVTMPQTLIGGKLTYDFSAVPVDVEVR